MPDADRESPLPLIVMGVSGSGKTTVASGLAARLSLPFIDGDDLHPQSNVDKMHAGHPLEDADRWPWLDRVAQALNDRAAAEGGVVLACSALKRAYRDRLRDGTAGRVRFAFLDASFGEIERRLKKRTDHFMPKNLLQSQFDTLERPGADEADVVTVPADRPDGEIVADIAGRFER